MAGAVSGKGGTESNNDPGYETRDLPAWSIAATIAGVLVGAAASAALASVLVMWFADRKPAPKAPLEAVRQVPPAPRLSVDPQADGNAVNRAAMDKLEGYAWADRDAGKVRIPIERAMQLLVEQGWPDQDQGKGE